MTGVLDPRFTLEIAAMDGLGWIDRAMARERAEGYARSAGLTYAEALHQIGIGAGAPMVRTPPAKAPASPTAPDDQPPAAQPHLSTEPPPAAKPRFVAIAVDVAAAIAAARP